MKTPPSPFCLPPFCATLMAVLLLLGACAVDKELADLQPTETQVPRSDSAMTPESRLQMELSKPGSGQAPASMPAPMPMSPLAPLAPMSMSPPAPPATWPGSDRFPDQEATGVISVAEQPVSTFSVDVDTASYAVVRRILSSGTLPPRESVRVEEMVNYFPYTYPAPPDRTQPFRVTTTVVPSPWNTDNQLLHIALRGYDIPRPERPRANLVLLMDTSGSMAPSDRLPLLQQAFRLFVEQLRPDDRLAIVTYAGATRVALEPTPGHAKKQILEALNGLQQGGSTAGGAGLQRAYDLAERHFDRDAVNRILLATDGDFNVGITDPKALERFIVSKRKTGIYLSIFGVGLGNLNDALTQRLAQAGNGNAAYIDTILEARKALSEELASTLFPIANDVKVQVEFNPARVAAYRLIGYETRLLRREDFKDDRVDAGDLGAGHTVTALYEMTPAGVPPSRLDPLRYQPARERLTPPSSSNQEELAFVKLRYKLPGEATSQLLEQLVRATAALAALTAAPPEVRFAIAVAAFAQRLRSESALEGFSYATIAELAQTARGSDPEGYRAEFVRLVRMAETLSAAGQR